MEKLKWNTKIWPIAQKEAGKSKYRNTHTYKRGKKQKTNNKIVDLNPNMSINKCIGINTLIKRRGLSRV